MGDAADTAKGLIAAWWRADGRKKLQVEQRLSFENLETLFKTLTTGRWVLLRKLHTSAPMSVRALAKELGRDYKNVHTDVRRLEVIGLIGRSKDSKIVGILGYCGSSPQAGGITMYLSRELSAIF